MKRVNFFLIEYAMNSLLRQKGKNIFIMLVLTLLTTLLSSMFFIVNSMKYELNSTVDLLPQIVVENMKAGRHCDIETSKLEDILSITGVNNAYARVWGYYYFAKEEVYFTLVGIDEFETQYSHTYQKASEKLDFTKPSMLMGRGVRKLLYKSYYKNYFNFIKPNGEIYKVNIAGVFDAQTNLESNDVIIMSQESVRTIFDMDENLATDIVVSVANKNEIPTVALKLQELFPQAKVVTKEQLKVSYENIFNYKSGIFLALFIISIFTFFIIIYDKASGLSSQEKREVGILKALGWRVEDVLTERFYESFILSFFSYVVGVSLSLFYVYILQAPLLKDVFIGYSNLKPEFHLPFIIDIQALFIVFFLSVPIYIASIIIPSWKIATLDADEVIR